MLQSNLAYESLSTQQEYQSGELLKTLQYLKLNSPFYRKLFREQGINIASIKGIEDLHHLPTTCKTDMQAQNMDFLCVPVNKISEYMATSGTLGKPVTVALTQNDLERLAYNEEQSFLCADGKQEDIYQLMLTLDRQFMAGMAYYKGIHKMGASVIRSGPGLPAMQWDIIQRLGTTSLVTVPSFLLKMIEWAAANNLDPKKTNVKKAICIGESLRRPDGSLNALGEKIHSHWPLALFGTYAATELQTAFTDCPAGKGGHHQPDLIIVEILDDEGNVLPDGVFGEVVITTLGIEGMPLLRYRTGDVCAIWSEPCSCGRKSKRLSHVAGRKQQMIKYKGTTIYPPAIFDILNELNYVNEYVVEVYTGQMGTDELKLHLHTTLAIDNCEHLLRPVLQARLRVIPLLHFHSAIEMQALQFPSGSRKTIRFLDNRTEYN